MAIEVAGHATECIASTGDPGFVQAELLADGPVVAASDAQTEAVRLTHRRPAERFSHARPAGEVWRLDAAYDAWRQGGFPATAVHAVEVVVGPGRLLPRGVPWPDGRRRPAAGVLGVHSFARDPAAFVPPIGPLETPAYLAHVSTLPERPAVECAAERAMPLNGDARLIHAPLGSPADPNDSPRVAIELADVRGPAGIDLDFGQMQAGFLSADFTTEIATTIDLVFVDHLGPGNTINARAGDMNGVVRLHVPAGRTRFTAFEPHAFRYVRVIARDTPAFTLHELAVVDHAHPDTLTHAFHCDDNDLNRIYAAARLTLRLNTQDVFMDCPGRERAGWLCDSLFSARAMHALFGDTSVERAMLENFLYAPESDEHPGYFPECYPGRAISGGNFIPNWSMFLGIQLAEYVARTGDTTRLLREMKALFLPMLAQGLGTLWEHRRLEGSVCHGFASHAAVWLRASLVGPGVLRQTTEP